MQGNEGAHNVDTQEEKVLTAMQSAHSVYEQRKEEEKKKNELKKRLEADKLEEQKRQQEQLKKVNKKKTSLDQKEGKLKEDEKKTNENYNVASRAFADATTSLQIAIDSNDMTGIRVAKDLLDSAKKRFEEVKAHREEQSKIRDNISQGYTEYIAATF